MFDLKVAKDLNNYSFVRLARATAMVGSQMEVNNTVRASFIYFRSVSLFVLFLCVPFAENRLIVYSRDRVFA